MENLNEKTANENLKNKQNNMKTNETRSTTGESRIDQKGQNTQPSNTKVDGLRQTKTSDDNRYESTEGIDDLSKKTSTIKDKPSYESDSSSREDVNYGQFDSSKPDKGQSRSNDSYEKGNVRSEGKNEESWKDQDVHKHPKKEIGSEREFQADEDHSVL